MSLRVSGNAPVSTHGVVLASPPALTCRRLVRRSSKFTAFLSARCAALSYPAPSHLPKCSRASSTNSQVPLTSTRLSTIACACAQARERSGDRDIGFKDWWCAGSLSAQRARSERSLRSRVNGFMLGDSGHAQARRRQLEQDHLRRGQLILHNMG